MKTFLRILSYAQPLPRYLVPYFLLTFLATMFGVFNFVLLQPLFEVLFKPEETMDSIAQQAPSFEFSKDFVSSLFYFYFGQYVKANGAVGGLKFVCYTLVGSVLLANIFRYLAILTLEQVRMNTLNNLRIDVFGKTVDLHLGFFANQRKGDLISRLNTDVMQVEHSVISSLTTFIREPLTLIGYFVVLFLMSPRLTLFTLILIPISGIFIASIVKKLRESAKKTQSAIGKMTSIIDEAFGGIRVVKAFNGENYVKNVFNNQSRKYVRYLYDMNRKTESTSPISEVLGVSVVAFIIYYGGTLVLDNNGSISLKAEEFIVYIAIFSQVLRPAKGITSSISIIQRGLAASQRVFSLIDEPPVVRDRPDADYLDRFENQISFRDMTFCYEKEKAVLSDINFTIQKGETVALVGPSGGGKSTIADLLPRFYDPDQGGIEIDGKDIRDYTVHSVRSHMGIVTQESILFNDTVFSNIAFCKTDATPEEVERAAKIANAHDFISAMDKGYQTQIGDRGIKLSGGQRQRISIARAVLMNPEILILDEATSALDTESEKLVQDALNKLMQNRTSLVIAHRLSTIHHADKIIVIEQGRIVEQGNHQSLMAKKDGLYRRLNRMQSLD